MYWPWIVGGIAVLVLASGVAVICACLNSGSSDEEEMYRQGNMPSQKR